jgi:hypothetical protein
MTIREVLFIQFLYITYVNFRQHLGYLLFFFHTLPFGQSVQASQISGISLREDEVYDRYCDMRDVISWTCDHSTSNIKHVVMYIKQSVSVKCLSLKHDQSDQNSFSWSIVWTIVSMAAKSSTHYTVNNAGSPIWMSFITQRTCVISRIWTQSWCHGGFECVQGQRISVNASG